MSTPITPEPFPEPEIVPGTSRPIPADPDVPPGDPEPEHEPGPEPDPF